MKSEYEVLLSETHDAFVMELRRSSDGALVFWRKSRRSGIPNTIGQITRMDAQGNPRLEPITEETGRKIIERILKGEHFSSCFLFPDEGVTLPESLLQSLQTKSEMEEKFTSTGAKFWGHPEAMNSYREGTGRTVVSTHISPEGRCNLACPYCSVTYRQVKSRLELSVIQRYVRDLKTRGLKAVILTGGGEPTLYPHINELLETLYSEGLKAALINNGTNLHRVRPELLHRLTWTRISVNIFPGWEQKIRIPADLSSHTTVGMSFVYTPQHEQPQFDLLDVLRRIKVLADGAGVKYIRLLPNCLLDQKSLLTEHLALSRVVAKLEDARFFHQGKIHEAPAADICHQSFFRPYLSEEPFPGETAAGSVFPCDSVVLNHDAEHFSRRYALCRPHEVLDYLDRRIEPHFTPRIHCAGCVFTNTVNMLEGFKNRGEERFKEFENADLQHVDFV